MLTEMRNEFYEGFITLIKKVEGQVTLEALVSYVELHKHSRGDFRSGTYFSMDNGVVIVFAPLAGTEGFMIKTFDIERPIFPIKFLEENYFDDNQATLLFDTSSLTLHYKEEFPAVEKRKYESARIDKNILVFDVESTSLYGLSFAFGAVVYDPEGMMMDSIDGVYVDISKIKEQYGVESSDWVKQNILETNILEGLTVYNSLESLRNSFWDFYTRWKDDCYIFADYGVPVEANLLRECIMDKPEEREFAGPYPLHEIATYLLALGEDPDVDKYKVIGLHSAKRHNPAYDAMVSGLYLLHKANGIKLS